MNPLAPLFLFALLAVTLTAVPPQPRPAAPATAPARVSDERTGGRECVPHGARLRDAGHGHERNELSPVQVAAVEREIAGLLTLGGPPGPGEQPLRASSVVRIPVYFHVLHDGARGRLSQREVDEQIEVLDSAYGGGFGGSDTGFDFVLKGVTRTDDPDWYGEPERHEAEFKRRLRRGGAATLNLYSADLGEHVLGWATFPWRYESEPAMDGVVVHVGSLPGGDIPHFDRGFTAVHEAGHWLGLYHTFQDGCEEPGDRVNDTPSQDEPTGGCPAHKNTCPRGGTDPVHNFMDYSHDPCMNQFSRGQGDRMHRAWRAYRT